MEHLDHPSPPPHFNDAKMARFALRASSSLLRGGGGLIVPFYTVQDCSSCAQRAAYHFEGPFRKEMLDREGEATNYPTMPCKFSQGGSLVVKIASKIIHRTGCGDCFLSNTTALSGVAGQF